MSFSILDLKNEKDWLIARKDGIGGSDASAIVGMNPYKTNLELFEEKTNRLEPEDISDKDCVKYGKAAEEHIRQLFALEYKDYQVFHNEFQLICNEEYPFMRASLDGTLVDPKGRYGILEIKTTNILQSMQREKWNDKIPDNYYIQVLHYMLVTGYEFVKLRARLISKWDDEIRATERTYHIERSEVLDDLEYLKDEEIKFWGYVQSGKKPPLVLPDVV